MQYSADLLLDPELDDVHVYDLPDGDTARLVQFTTPIPSGWSADDLAYGSPVRVSGQVGPVQCHASTYTRNKLGSAREVATVRAYVALRTDEESPTVTVSSSVLDAMPRPNELVPISASTGAALLGELQLVFETLEGEAVADLIPNPWTDPARVRIVRTGPYATTFRAHGLVNVKEQDTPVANLGGYVAYVTVYVNPNGDNAVSVDVVHSAGVMLDDEQALCGDCWYRKVEVRTPSGFAVHKRMQANTAYALDQEPTGAHAAVLTGGEAGEAVCVPRTRHMVHRFDVLPLSITKAPIAHADARTWEHAQLASYGPARVSLPRLTDFDDYPSAWDLTSKLNQPESAWYSFPGSSDLLSAMYGNMRTIGVPYRGATGGGRVEPFRGAAGVRTRAAREWCYNLHALQENRMRSVWSPDMQPVSVLDLPGQVSDFMWRSGDPFDAPALPVEQPDDVPQWYFDLHAQHFDDYNGYQPSDRQHLIDATRFDVELVWMLDDDIAKELANGRVELCVGNPLYVPTDQSSTGGADQTNQGTELGRAEGWMMYGAALASATGFASDRVEDWTREAFACASAAQMPNGSPSRACFMKHTERYTPPHKYSATITMEHHICTIGLWAVARSVPGVDLMGADVLAIGLARYTMQVAYRRKSLAFWWDVACGPPLLSHKFYNDDALPFGPHAIPEDGYIGAEVNGGGNEVAMDKLYALWAYGFAAYLGVRGDYSNYLSDSISDLDWLQAQGFKTLTHSANLLAELQQAKAAE